LSRLTRYSKDRKKSYHPKLQGCKTIQAASTCMGELLLPGILESSGVMPVIASG
jgi:hypothetical protein